MNYIRRLKSRKGLTLVEVLIATVIFALILLAAFTMYQPVNEIAAIVKGDSDAQRIVSAAEGFIAYQIRNAAEISILWGSPVALPANYRNWNNTNPIPANPINWNTVAGQMYDFAEDKTEFGDQPQALIIRQVRGRTYIYNIRLRDFFNRWDHMGNARPASGHRTAANLATILNFPANGADPTAFGGITLEDYRAFSRSFYGDINLDFEIQLSETRPGNQARGKTFLTMQVNAFRGLETTVTLDSRSRTDTQLSWIGKHGGTGDGNPDNTFLRARIFPAINNPAQLDEVISNFNSAVGDIVILYHNNMHRNRA